MLEPPSPKLVQTLLGLKLCTAADLQRSHRRVRRLARDLPAFDSIWIDALLQARKLTSFQALLLESQPERLAVGPCVLVERLGQGRHAATYLARRREGRERCVLKQIEPPPESLTLGLASLERLTARLEGLAHPSVAAPHTSLRHGDHLVTVSRYVPGLHLAELLVRRGRFPAAVVSALARQLVDGLAALEERGVVHGDIRPCNVRLTAGGVATLVDAGIGPALRPELMIDPATPPDRYDGIAPERIGTGEAPTAATDVYALGCLLWHLLAGRPPFPTGDPLAKLAAHQTRAIDDVRALAPDTPPALAALICTFTAADPADRPTNFRAIREGLGPPRRSDRRRLARFRGSFETAARHVPNGFAAPPAARWPMRLMMLAVAALAVVSFTHGGTRSTLMHIAAHVTQTTRRVAGTADPEPHPADAAPRQPALLPLPKPDAQNVILLAQRGPYAAGPINSVGPVTIRAADGVRPEIMIGDQPCRIVATHIMIENLTFRLGARPSRPHDAGETPALRQTAPESVALLLVQSERLDVRGCRFELPETADSPSSQTAVGWEALETDGRSGRLALRDCVFPGGGSALSLESAPAEVALTNCLKTTGGPLLSCRKLPVAGHELRVALDHVTLRAAGAILWGRLPEERPGRVTISATDCVFDLSGPEAALLQIVAAPGRRDWTDALEITGIGSLARDGLPVALQVDPMSGAANMVDPAAVFVEGISAAAYRFAGPLTARAADSVITDHQAATRSSKPPGIDAAALGSSNGSVR